MVTSTTQKNASTARKAKREALAQEMEANRLANIVELGRMRIAPETMNEASARNVLIATVKETLDADPSQANKDACQLEFVIGNVAEALRPVGRCAHAFPEGKRPTQANLLAHARMLCVDYGMPVEKGKEPGPLRAGKKGRRDETTELVRRNAEKRWSTILGEAGHGAAATVKAKSAKKRKKAGAQTTPKAPVAPVETAPDAPETAETVNAMLISKLLDAFKYAQDKAKLVDGSIGLLVKQFHTALAEANKARHEAIAAAEAKAKAMKEIADAADRQSAGTIGAAVAGKRKRARK